MLRTMTGAGPRRVLSIVLVAVALHAARSSSAADAPVLARESLAGRRFEFSWRSAEGGAVNGIATLRPDGTIAGIGSPNETTWLIDEAGKLLFKHADGRVSTRYDEVRREDGLLHFTGPFLFRAGITHHLVELESAASDREHRMTDALAAKITYSTQRFVYLDIGESHTFRLKNGTEKHIRLVSVTEFQDPVIELTRSAKVHVKIDGRPVGLLCAPYVMPTVTEGIRIQADTTSAWLRIPKRVQFSLWDRDDPIVDTSRFGFPLAGYRLFSHGMQAYNEPVHLGDRDGDPAGQRFHHNYGVDLAGYEGRQKVMSCIDGVVIEANRREGDLLVQDDAGFVVHFGHLDAILSGITVGARVTRGQWVGMLGRRGASGNFSHLHVGTATDRTRGQPNRNLNLFPWLVAAYEAGHGAALHAVARPHQAVLTGDRVRFDALRSIVPDAAGAAFRWEFHDGVSIEGPEAEAVYEKPGCYMATLWVEDSRGRIDVDFCTVRVYTRGAPETVVPTLFATHAPAAFIRVDQPVAFRLWPQGEPVADIRIDFGDGTVIEDYRPYSAVVHAFAQPGLHVVTAAGTAGALPVMQKLKVVVEE